MRKHARIALFLSLTALVSFASCKDKEETKPAQPAETQPETTDEAKPEEKMAAPAKPIDKSADVAHAAEVWTAVEKYREWPKLTEAPVKGQEPHGAFVHLFYNDAVRGAIGGEGAWPDGSVFVKDNFMPNDAKDGPGTLAAITVMHKEGDKWFWAKYKADGSLHKTAADDEMPNMPIAGYEKLRCIGCHESSETRDMVITEIVESK